MSVFDFQNRRGVGIIERILHPYQLQGIYVQTHQVSAIVCHKDIALIDSSTVLHAKPERLVTASCSIITPFHDSAWIDG